MQLRAKPTATGLASRSPLKCYRPAHNRQLLVRNVAAISTAGQFTPSKVAIFVEPSPFSHISGMKNRFESLIKNLKDQGDDVMVFTPDPTPPKEFCGAQVSADARISSAKAAE